MLAHDLRNPLASIDAGVACCCVEKPMKRRRAKSATLTRKSVKRMSGLIDDILDFAKGQLGGGFTSTAIPIRRSLIIWSK